MSAALGLPPPWLHTLHDEDTRPSAGPTLRLRRRSGTLVLDGVSGPPGAIRPMAEGRPALADCRLERAQLRGGTLAAYLSGRGGQAAWHLFSTADGAPLPTRDARGPDDLTLSGDGRLAAIRQADHRFGVVVVDEPGPPLLATRRPADPGRLVLQMGRDWIESWTISERR